MQGRTSRYTEFIVMVVSQPSDPSELNSASDQPEQTRSYNAFVYGDLEVPGLIPISGTPEDQPAELGDLHLLGAEKVVINWTAYKKYKSIFHEGENAASELLSRDEIFKDLSPGLASLLSGQAISNRPLRIWWACASPRLVQLPWELLAYEGETGAPGEFYFVRGLPPEAPVPKIPVSANLRLAFIHEPSSTPVELMEALQAIPGIDLTDMKKPPLEALREAVRDGFELVHLVADGSVSLTYEGFLYLQKPLEGGRSLNLSTVTARSGIRAAFGLFKKLESILPKSWSEWLNGGFSRSLEIETLSPNQLSALQRGSRLAVLSLSPPRSADPEVNKLNASLLPSIYSAFACLGNSPLPMPNIVAQIGAAQPETLKNFWRAFYTELQNSLKVENAVSKGLEGNTSLPIALFLRQNLGKTFKREAAQEAANVTQINAELQQSKETLKRLLTLKDSPLGDIVAEYEKSASARQEELQTKLDPWLEEEEINQS
jgi:hypothetical protein